jgi:hypothetical protein
MRSESDEQKLEALQEQITATIDARREIKLDNQRRYNLITDELNAIS